MVLGRAWTAAMEKAVVEPAKLATLGHVQVFAKDAAADEGGESPSSRPRTTTASSREPQKLIDRVLRAEPRLAAGLARLMVGALLSSGDVSMEGILIGIDPRPAPPSIPRSSCARAASSSRGRRASCSTAASRGSSAWAWAGRWSRSATRPTAVSGGEAHRHRHLDGARSRGLRVGVLLRGPRGGAGAARRGRRGGGARLPPEGRRPAVRARRRVAHGGPSARRHPRPGLHLGGDGRALHRRACSSRASWAGSWTSSWRSSWPPAS